MNNAISIPEIPELALALSGGGFRATYFHAGVTRTLVRMGLKERIKLISSVSGASILSALFGLHYDEINSLADYDRLVLEPLINMTQKNIRTKILSTLPGGILRGLSPDFLNRVITIIGVKDSSGKTISLFDKYLYHEKTLASLSKNIRIVINATSLNSGIRWRFERDDFGDYKTGYSYDVEKIKLSEAVTASAAYPLLIKPVKVITSNLTFNIRNKEKVEIGINPSPPRLICLSDGGIYDNLGIYSIERDLQVNNRFVIVSDAAQRFDQNHKEYNRANSAMRINSILMEESNSRKRREIFRKFDNGTWSGIMFKLENSSEYYRNFSHRNGTPPELMDTECGWDDEIVKLLGSMRTDLDNFHKLEIASLIYHGESLMETNIMKWHYPLYQAITHQANYLPLEKPNISNKDLMQILRKSNKYLRYY